MSNTFKWEITVARRWSSDGDYAVLCTYVYRYRLPLIPGPPRGASEDARVRVLIFRNFQLRQSTSLSVSRSDISASCHSKIFFESTRNRESRLYVVLVNRPASKAVHDISSGLDFI